MDEGEPGKGRKKEGERDSGEGREEGIGHHHLEIHSLLGLEERRFV